MTWARFLSFARSKLWLCSANHRTSVTWPVIGWALAELTLSKGQKTDPGEAPHTLITWSMSSVTCRRFVTRHIWYVKRYKLITRNMSLTARRYDFCHTTNSFRNTCMFMPRHAFVTWHKIKICDQFCRVTKFCNARHRDASLFVNYTLLALCFTNKQNHIIFCYHKSLS